MDRRVGLLLIAVVAVNVAGCRWKGLESHISATTPNPPGTWKGDPYAFGGNAAANGGTNTKTNWGKGARAKVNEPADPILNRPAYGTGSMKGEIPQSPSGSASTNSPAKQPTTGQY